MWLPQRIKKTRADEREENERDRSSLNSLWLRFGFYQNLVTSKERNNNLSMTF